MPKAKTHSGLKKRIKITGSGKIKRGHSYTGHLKTNKSHKQNKNLANKPDQFDAKFIKCSNKFYQFL